MQQPSPEPDSDAASDSGLTVVFHRLERGAFLELVGELDLAAAAPLTDAWSTARADADAVVVDLRQLSFMDVAGLRLLLELAGEPDGDHPRLAFVRPAEHVDRLFELTHTRSRMAFVDVAPQASMAAVVRTLML